MNAPEHTSYWIEREEALALLSGNREPGGGSLSTVYSVHETAIERARSGDFSGVQKVLAVLRRPFDEQPEHEAYAGFPPDWAAQLEVSCSS